MTMTTQTTMGTRLHPTIRYIAERQDQWGWSNRQVARMLGITVSPWRNLRLGVNQPSERVLRCAWIRFPEAPGRADEEQAHSA